MREWGAVSFLSYGCRYFWYTVLLLGLPIPESDKEEKPQNAVIPKEVTPALCSLMSSYGSLSGSESEPEGKLWPQLLQLGLFVAFCLWCTLRISSILPCVCIWGQDVSCTFFDPQVPSSFDSEVNMGWNEVGEMGKCIAPLGEKGKQ